MSDSKPPTFKLDDDKDVLGRLCALSWFDGVRGEYELLVNVGEDDARDLVAKLTAWLDAPRLEARETPTVVARDKGHYMRDGVLVSRFLCDPCWVDLLALVRQCLTAHGIPVAVGLAAEADRLRAGMAAAPGTIGRETECQNNSPAGFAGHWRDWHRGHGCDKDPERGGLR